MTALLAAAAALLCLAAGRELLAELRPRRGTLAARLLDPSGAERARALAAAAIRLGIPERLRRAGLEGRIGVGAVLAAKAACAAVATPVAVAAAPVAPGRLGFVVLLGLPAAGFLAPDAVLERSARLRAKKLVAALPDALDLLAVGAASGRSPATGMAEIATTQSGPLATELAVTVAELDCGNSQSDALAGLRRRAPAPEVSSLVAVIERSARYGSPLAGQLRGHATALRGDQRRAIEEQAARAAPKIQLAVALLLVPSVLLMIASALIANADLLTSGF